MGRLVYDYTRLREPNLLIPGKIPFGRIRFLKKARMPTYYWPMLPGTFGVRNYTELYSDRTNMSGHEYFGGPGLHSYHNVFPERQSDGSLYFTGGNHAAYNDTISKPSGTPAENRTLILRFKLGLADSTQQAIAGHLNPWGGSLGNYGLGIYYDNGTLVAIGSANNGRKISAPFSDTSRWHTVAARFSTDGALYLDGVKAASGNLGSGWGYIFALGNAMSAVSSYNNLLTGHVQHVLYDLTGWSDAELQAITFDPFHIFRAD